MASPNGNELNVRIKHLFKSQAVFIHKLNRIGCFTFLKNVIDYYERLRLECESFDVKAERLRRELY